MLLGPAQNHVATFTGFRVYTFGRQPSTYAVNRNNLKIIDIKPRIGARSISAAQHQHLALLSMAPTGCRSQHPCRQRVEWAVPSNRRTAPFPSRGGAVRLRAWSVNPSHKGIWEGWRELRRIFTCRGFNPSQSPPNHFKSQGTEQGLNGGLYGRNELETTCEVSVVHVRSPSR